MEVKKAISDVGKLNAEKELLGITVAEGTTVVDGNLMLGSLTFDMARAIGFALLGIWKLFEWQFNMWMIPQLNRIYARKAATIMVRAKLKGARIGQGRICTIANNDEVKRLAFSISFLILILILILISQVKRLVFSISFRTKQQFESGTCRTNTIIGWLNGAASKVAKVS